MIGQSQLIRIQLNTFIANSLSSLPILSSIPEDQRASILQTTNRNEIRQFYSSVKDPSYLPLPPQVRAILEQGVAIYNQALEHSKSLIDRLTQFLQMSIKYSVEDLSSNKAKAMYGLIPSCEELIQVISEQKKEEKEEEERAGGMDVIAMMEERVEGKGEMKAKGDQRELSAKENGGEKEEEEEDFSERLGVADGMTSLSHFKRRGIQLSPWVWYGSLTAHPDKANVEYYPDLIVDGMTVRWDCPVCHETMYVTKEELICHLNKCVHWGFC